MNDHSELEAHVAELIERHNAAKQPDQLQGRVDGEGTEALKQVIEHGRTRIVTVAHVFTDAESNHGIRRGDIRVAHPDPSKPETMSRYVLVDRIAASGTYASVLLLDNLPGFADDHDLILQPGESGLGFESVVHANVRHPLWFTQLGDRRGAVTEEELLDLLPRIAKGAVPAEHAHRTGLPLQSLEDPRRDHKREENRELMEIAKGCIERLIEGGDFFGAGEPDDLPEYDELIGTLDPGVLHTRLAPGTEPRFMRSLSVLLHENPAVELPTLTPQLVDDYVEAIRTTFGRAQAENFLKAHPPRLPQRREPSEDEIQYVYATV